MEEAIIFHPRIIPTNRKNLTDKMDAFKGESKSSHLFMKTT